MDIGLDSGAVYASESRCVSFSETLVPDMGSGLLLKRCLCPLYWGHLPWAAVSYCLVAMSNGTGSVCSPCRLVLPFSHISVVLGLFNLGYSLLSLLLSYSESLLVYLVFLTVCSFISTCWLSRVKLDPLHSCSLFQ